MGIWMREAKGFSMLGGLLPVLCDGLNYGNGLG